MSRILVNENFGPIADTALAFDVVQVSGRGVFNLSTALVDVYDTVYTRIEIDRAVNVTTDRAVYISGDDTGSNDNSITIGKRGALRVDSNQQAIVTEGRNDFVENNGLLSGATGVQMHGAYARVENNGRIFGDLNAIIFEASATGASLVNTGRIISDGASGIRSFAQATTIENDGLIKGEYGLFLTGIGSSIENTGRIFGGNTGVYTTVAATILNDGMISAGSIAVQMIGGGWFENNGTIKSDGQPHSFATYNKVAFTNAGKVVNNALLSYDDDFFENVKGGVVTGIIQGREGNDVLLGGRKADRIDGGAGDDVINGDRGNDRLTGGTDDDTFVYAGKKMGVDRITDFEVGADFIDLSAYGIDVEAFVARALSVRGENTIINLNKIGNGVSGKIILLGVNADLDKSLGGDEALLDYFIF